MKYRISVPIIRVKGAQHYLIEAESIEDAIRKHDAGESTFECEEFEVQQVSSVCFTDVTEAEDE